MHTSSPRWSLRLFGDFQLIEQASGEKVAVTGRRERVLLAYLALSPDGRQPRRKLTTLLWGEAADETTLDNLRTSVFNLRKALGDTERSIIASEDRDIVLDVSAFEVDVLEFRRLAAASGVAELEEAAKLYTGDFLEGLSIESEEFESWRRAESTRCKGQVLDVLTRLMAQLAAAGENDRAIETGLRILLLEPLHEAAVRHLMRLYAGSGRRATAVELYRTLADSLKKELGAQPEAETRAVYGEITRGGEAQIAAIGDVKSPPPTSMAQSVPSAAEDVFPAIGSTPIALQKGNRRKIGWLAGGLAAAATAAMLLFVTFAPSSDPAPTGGPATVVAATPTSAIALAVLPFANLSSDPEQEFFSDGITEEITSALAKIPDLSIVARTSAFEFKGQNRNIRMIGEQLGATHLIEGSVRKAGDRVRITVQLIRADGGTRIWSDDYDRQLTDIFAIQEEIATAVAASLRMPLGLAPGERLVSNRNIDPESYQQYLRARPLYRARERGVPAAVEILEPLVARNPDFAPAWALLARAYQYNPLSGEERVRRREEFRSKADGAARRAIQLDRNIPDAYLALGRMATLRGKLVEADNLNSKALALDSNNPDALQMHAMFLAIVGRQKEALALAQQLIALEPHVPTFLADVGEILWENGQDAAAIEMLRSLVATGRARQSLAMIYASQGRYKEAVDMLELHVTDDILPPGFEPAARTAVGFLRMAPAKAVLPPKLPRLGAMSFVYLHVGAPDRALELYEDAAADGALPGRGGDAGFLWHPSYAAARHTERFKTFVRNAGMVDYWRARGWPSLCRPVGANDFACD